MEAACGGASRRRYPRDSERGAASIASRLVHAAHTAELSKQTDGCHSGARAKIRDLRAPNSLFQSRRRCTSQIARSEPTTPSTPTSNVGDVYQALVRLYRALGGG